MAFYLNPPSGTLTLSSVERYARARLNFLLKVARCHGNSVAMQDIVLDSETVTSADCLTEGSSKDRISHYVLRLACAGDKEMSSFYVRAESYFFRYRVSCMTEDELVLHVVRPLQKLGELLMTEVNPLAPAMVDIAEILGYMTYSCDIETIVHYFVEGVKNKFFVLRFEHVLGLVAGRAVTVRRGKAVVPCTRLCEVLEVIFGKLLTYGMSLAKKKYAAVIEDKRFCRLFSCLRSLFYSQLSVLRGGRPSLFGVVRAEDVDALTDYYPLCMSTLHRLLKQRHRLKHADRIQYTLYLKELGMPVHEAVHFWRREYSEPAVCLKDDHDQSWGRNARRYTYNIRHLYGLEGARVNYRGHRCTALQGRSLGPLEAGGCPFSNCDSDSLQQLLITEGIPKQHRHVIASLATEKSPQTACQMFFRQKLATSLGREMILPGEMDSRKNCDGCKSPRILEMKEECSCKASYQKSKSPKNTEIRQNSCCPESFQKRMGLEVHQMYKQEYSCEESNQKCESHKMPKIKHECPSEYTYQELKSSEVTKKKLESPYKNFCQNCRNLKFGPYKNFCQNCGNLKLGSMKEECSCENSNQTSKASEVTRVQQECLVGEYCQKRRGHKAAEIKQKIFHQDSCQEGKAFIEQGCSCDKGCEKRKNPEVTNLKQGCMEERSWHQDKRSKFEADKEWPCSRRIQGLVKTEESVTTVCLKSNTKEGHTQSTQTVSSAPSRITEGHVEQRLWSPSCATKRCYSAPKEQRMLSSSYATKMCHSHCGEQRMLSSSFVTKICHSAEDQRMLSSCATKMCHSHPEDQRMSSLRVTKRCHSPKDQRMLSSCATKRSHSHPSDQRILSSCATKMCHSHPEDQRMSSFHVNKRCHSPSCTQSPPQKSPSISKRDKKSHQVWHGVMKEKIANLNFLKPADYSSSFKKLLEGLSK